MDVASTPKWFGSKWTWAVPSGCLLLVLVVALFIGSIFFFVFSMMKSNDAYQHALAAARKDPEVAAALGQPLHEGWFISGNFEENGASGQASFSIPVSGPKGSGTVYVEARKAAGQWHYSTRVLEVEASKQRIDLLDPPVAPSD